MKTLLLSDSTIHQVAAALLGAAAVQVSPRYHMAVWIDLAVKLRVNGAQSAWFTEFGAFVNALLRETPLTPDERQHLTEIAAAAAELAQALAPVPPPTTASP